MFYVMACKSMAYPLTRDGLWAQTPWKWMSGICCPMGVTANLAKPTSLLSATIMSSTYLVVFCASLLCCKGEHENRQSGKHITLCTHHV